MGVSAQDVKALRDKTGAGMMDCKRALKEAGGDPEKARLVLREKGLAKAQQKEISFTEVIGGIGYIFGIVGIILYFAGKKKEGKNKDASTRD